MLLKGDLKGKMLRQLNARLGQILLQGLFRHFPDDAAGQSGIDATGGAAKAVLHRHGIEHGMQVPAVLGEHFVAGEQNGGDALQGAGVAVEHEFRAGPAVEQNIGGLGGKGMGQRIAAAAGGGMVAHEQRCVIGLVHAVHHAQRAARPAADDLRALRQLVHIQIDGIIVGVLDQDMIRAGGDGALAGRLDLPGHLLGSGRIDALAHLGLIPKGGEGGSLDICTDKNAHAACPP